MHPLMILSLVGLAHSLPALPEGEMSGLEERTFDCSSSLSAATVSAETFRKCCPSYEYEAETFRKCCTQDFSAETWGKCCKGMTS